MSHPEPLVSVLIPTRNRKELLHDAISSVLFQTYSNLQIIIQDNSSNDETDLYLKEHIHDSRVEYYRAGGYLSMNENWNEGFGRVKGEYVVRLDDDNVFSNDFVETALRTMQEGGYDVMTYSPLIVNLRNAVYALFIPEDTVYTLTPSQVVYLEYFNLTDSNYTLYTTDAIRKIFPDGNVYITTLPDRYMQYSLVNAVPDIRIGFSSAIKGVTRFDYRAPYTSEYHLAYVDYDALSLDEILQQKDCLSNFHMHRAATMQYFLERNTPGVIADFFTQKISTPPFDRTLMKMGHIYMAGEAYSGKELSIYIRYVMQIFVALWRNPFHRFESRNVLLNTIALGRNAFLAAIRSCMNILFHRTRVAIQPDPTKGNSIVRDIITGKPISSYMQYSTKGNLKSFLTSIL